MQRKHLLALALVAVAAIGAGLLLRAGPRRDAPPAAVDDAAESIRKKGVAKPIVLTAEQIAAEKIETARVGPGFLSRRITVPAAIKPDPDRLARVAARVSGVVAELRKRLGASVTRNETIAVIDSREVADAKSEYLAAAVNFDLQTQLFQREKGLFEKKITAEVLFLKAKAAFTEARLRLDLARQKLAALELSEAEIANLPQRPIESLRQKEIHAPMSGRVIERLVNIGQPVTPETQLYVLSDLAVVEADLAVPVASLASIQPGQPVTLRTADGRTMEGVVSVINAMITAETRTGHVIGSFKNPDFALNPGVLLNAEIALARTPVNALAPNTAIQHIHNEPVVFVRTGEGFEARAIKIGDSDGKDTEIIHGVEPGETIAISNTFLLKAEAGKSEIPEE